ncbi:MAG TPA: hypothetical protein VG889_18765 [Rhizomicrobium sp.]|nr:hypothetical protein [Rhizomicrobium sp.]
MSDPRERGFNYGKGWGSAPKPPIFLHATKLAHQLGQQAMALSARAWALEMALRNVRLATTGVEKVIAVRELERETERLELTDD